MEQLSIDNYITETLSKRDVTIPRIENYIPHGKDNAISRERLSEITGLSDRRVRKAIEYARLDDVIILNLQDGNGYFQSDNPDEIEQNYRQEYSRAISILARLKYPKQRLRAAGVNI